MHVILRAGLLSLGGVVLLAEPAGAQDYVRKVVTPQVTVELISSRTAPAAGDTWMGVRFILSAGWHVYWRNPGDSGGPPTLRWTTPAGVTVSAIEWPVPERIPYGPMVNYGYHGDVVLPVRLQAAKPPSGPVTATATWIVCKEICVPGKANLGLELPLTGDAAAAVPDWTAMIDRARARVPPPMPAGWRAEAVDAGDSFTLTVTTGSRETGGAFFSQEEGVIDEAQPQAPVPFDRGIRLTLGKSNVLSGTPKALRGVVVLDSGRAVDIVAAVSSGGTPSSKE